VPLVGDQAAAQGLANSNDDKISFRFNLMILEVNNEASGGLKKELDLF
jgi:hypothetical protein